MVCCCRGGKIGLWFVVVGGGKVELWFVVVVGGKVELWCVVVGRGKVELWFVVVGGGKVELWDLETVQSVQSLHAHDEAVTCITVSKHSMYIQPQGLYFKLPDFCYSND